MDSPTTEGRALLAEINKARVNPQGCIEDIKAQLGKFESANVMRTAKGERLRVMEGKHVWQDAILYLERAKPKDPLVWSNELADVSVEYDKHHAKGEEVSPFNILKSHYQYEGSISFNISESQVEQNLREMVIAMVIGDGDEEKGNRTTVFNPSFLCFGGLVVKRGKKTVAPMFFSDTNQFHPKSEGGENTPSAKTNTSNPDSYSPAKAMEVGKQMFAQINSIRREPKKLIPLLKADLSRFKEDKTLVKDGLNIKTKEGKDSYLDLISQLEEAYPVPLIKYSEGLSIAAAQQVGELQQRSEGESLTSNHNGYLKKYTTVSEGMNNIAMNRSEGESIMDMLILLLTGDGDKKRSARRKLLGPVLKVAGIAVGQKYFVVNIGENCRDNKETVEDYLTGLSNPHSAQEKTAVFGKQKKEKAPIQPSVTSPAQKLVTKKTTKTSTSVRNGKNYKVVSTKIQYDDGTTEEIEEQQLVE